MNGGEFITIVLSIGVPVLLVVFYLEGLVVGKVLQAPVLFIGYVVAVDPPRAVTVGLVAGCAWYPR